MSSTSVDQKKLRALALRFTEGPINDPIICPSSFISGPSAFLRIRLERQAIATTAKFSLSRNKVNELRREIIQSIKNTSQLQAKFLESVDSSKDCKQLKALVLGLSQIRNDIYDVIERLENEKKRMEKRKERRRRFLEKARRIAALCFVDHHRAIREIERRDLVKIVDEFGLQLLLQPIREPPSIIKDEMTVSTICNEEIPKHIQNLLSEIEPRVNPKKSSIPSITSPTINAAFKDLPLKLPPSINGRFSQRDLTQLAHVLSLSNSNSLTTLCSDEYQNALKQVQHVLRCHSLSAWSNYHADLKRFRRYIEEQTSPYRFFPLLRQDQPIRLLNLLGKGGFAEVWEGLHMETWEIKAIKITEFHTTTTPEERELILTSTCREVSLQRGLKHSHVVEMQQCFEITSSVFVASLDLCEGGSLDSIIQRLGPIPEPLAKRWTFQILKALEYLHLSGKVVHFDLKPMNVLLHHSNIKIADFGLHQPVNSKEGIATLDMRDYLNQIGTVWYMPPEHLKAALLRDKSQFDGRFDTWSVGIVLFEMLFQRRPFGKFHSFTGLTVDHVAALIYRDFINLRLHFPLELNPISNECKTFISRLLQPSHLRPTATQAISDPFFADLFWPNECTL